MRKLLPVIAILALLAGSGCGRNSTPGTTVTDTTYYDQYGNPIDPYAYQQQYQQYGPSIQESYEVPQGWFLLLYQSGQWTGKSFEYSSDPYSICLDANYARPEFYIGKQLEIRMWDGDQYVSEPIGYLVYGTSGANTFDARYAVPQTCGAPY